MGAVPLVTPLPGEGVLGAEVWPPPPPEDCAFAFGTNGIKQMAHTAASHLQNMVSTRIISHPPESTLPGSSALLTKRNASRKRDSRRKAEGSGLTQRSG